MSYSKDPDILLRGIGAIASRDAGSIPQLRRRQARSRVLRRRDARLGRMTYEQRAAMGLGGPGLTADTRTVKLTQYGPGSWTQLPVKPTGVNSVGVRQMYVPPSPGTTTPGFTIGTKDDHQPKPPKDPVTGVDTPRGTTKPPPMTMYVCPDGTRVSDPSMCAQPIVVPTAPPPDLSTTGGGGGGGGGGGSMMFTCPDGTKVADLSQCPQPAPSSTPLPDAPEGKSNGLLIAAGIGILYLLFRDKKDQR